MHTATFTITMIHFTGERSGMTEKVIAVEDTPAAAEMIGMVRAFQLAGWSAYASGIAEVVHVESGRKWAVNVKEF